MTDIPALIALVGALTGPDREALQAQEADRG